MDYRPPPVTTFVFGLLLSCGARSAVAQVEAGYDVIQRNAGALAGCYRFSRPLSDSLAIPDTLRLLLHPVRELGYHRLGSFRTTLRKLTTGETPPIWTPLAADSLLIEFDPRSVPAWAFTVVRLQVRPDSVRGMIEERRWDSQSPPRPVTVVARPVVGTRIPCH
jgi:hypothetical protein